MNLKTKNIVKVAAIVIVTMITILLVLFFNTSNPSKSAEGEDKIVMATTSTSTSIPECTSTTTNTTSISTIESTLTSTTNTTSITSKKNKETDRVKTTKEKKTTVATTPVNIIETTTTTVAIIEVPTEAPTEPVETYVVFKPETHYIHKNSCHWAAQGIIERIETTEGIEARRCSECNPEIEIIKEYIPPVISFGINEYDRQLLAEIVWHEAGSDWISQYEKARVCAGVMNRVKDSRFPSTVYGVLTQKNQFSGYWPGCCIPTQACYNAVDYYFNHTNEFGNENSWWGDGYQNHFYYQ